MRLLLQGIAACSVNSLLVSVCWSRPWALQKWLNRSRCRWRYCLGGPKEPCITCGAHLRHPVNTIERSVCGGGGGRRTVATIYSLSPCFHWLIYSWFTAYYTQLTNSRFVYVDQARRCAGDSLTEVALVRRRCTSACSKPRGCTPTSPNACCASIHNSSTTSTSTTSSTVSLNSNACWPSEIVRVHVCYALRDASVYCNSNNCVGRVGKKGHNWRWSRRTANTAWSTKQCQLCSRLLFFGNLHFVTQ